MVPRGWQMNAKPRVLFMGTGGTFSRVPLLALLEGGAQVVAVVVPRSRPGPGAARPWRELVPARGLRMLSNATSQSVQSIAWDRSISVWEVGTLRHPDVVSAIAALRPDVICVSCFPRRLPQEILDLPRLGCLNVHPSLLPDNRGPVPLFWTFREGAASTGVTVHRMTPGFDEGDIIEQTALPVPVGIRGEDMDQRCATVGGELLVRAVEKVATGTAVSRPQGPGTYHGWPGPGDFDICVSWSAERAFRFVRGISDWSRPAVILVGEERFPVRDASGYLDTLQLPEPYVCHGNEVWIQFSPGVLIARSRNTER